MIFSHNSSALRLALSLAASGGTAVVGSGGSNRHDGNDDDGRNNVMAKSIDVSSFTMVRDDENDKEQFNKPNQDDDVAMTSLPRASYLKGSLLKGAENKKKTSSTITDVGILHKHNNRMLPASDIGRAKALEKARSINVGVTLKDTVSLTK